MRFSLLLLSLAGLAACSNDLDRSRCDDAMARTLVYSNGALAPSYAGQAQIIASCEFCHATDPPGTLDESNRHGAPHSLNWDLDVATSTVESTDRLRAGQQLSYDLRGDMWGQVSGGSMPPAHTDHVTVNLVSGGTSQSLADRVNDRDVGYHYADGTPLERVNTVEGRAILRNWLACGLPVVERTDSHPRPDGEAPIGAVLSDVCAIDADCHTGFRCDTVTAHCVLKTDWPSIYTGYIQPTCAVGGCHADMTHISGMFLDPASPAAARATLVNQPSTSPACGTPGLLRVDTAHPDDSLLLAKLVGHYTDPAMVVCGPIMPFGTGAPFDAMDPEIIVPIRAWIVAGALP